ncbi:OLC1v1037588C1 [Oldenlandia corymbosa var. corymbosa]|uniref:OLC1v1037588C1 n=1 Tax=Oldenlandia corymbosa var. corymbosa TaxID=529605 RepID=A0AAV1CZ76_OLDCO|nr:OLC1v1037588C1 [Oldenlandia corymbosa var. corymbosa]
MDPCPFVRLIVESLALKLPSSPHKPAAGAGVLHPSSTPCYAKLKLTNFPSQTALIPLSTSDHSSSSSPPDSSTSSAAGFHLDPATLRRIRSKPVVSLKVSVFTGRMGRTCGVASGKLLGSVKLSINLTGAQSKPAVHQNGWMKLSGTGHYYVGLEPKLHVLVRSEPDPRFVFQFGGEPECSPVVFQIQENIRQPVFSCKFSADRNNRSRSLPSDFNNGNKGWMMRTLSGDKEKVGRERKGWMIIIYDLSGSAVAAASMITPFVPSPGSDRVSRSNPGAWLILRPNGSSVSSWKPWGRLEAWRERGAVDGLGYKFELVTDSGLTSGVPIAEGTMSVRKGGQFCIDNARKESSILPVRGFVMGSSVEAEGKVSKPLVQVGVRHVTCMADAALFVALSAAIDLSMDACRLFSQKLRKEFFPDDQESLS